MEKLDSGVQLTEEETKKELNRERQLFREEQKLRIQKFNNFIDVDFSTRESLTQCYNYIDFWAHSDEELLRSECRVCQWTMNKNRIVEADEVNAFGGCMPLNFCGTLLIWRYMCKEFNITDANESLRIDPWSIFAHTQLRVCPNFNIATNEVHSLIREFYIHKNKLLQIYPSLEKERERQSRELFSTEVNSAEETISENHSTDDENEEDEDGFSDVAAYACQDNNVGSEVEVDSIAIGTSERESLTAIMRAQRERKRKYKDQYNEKARKKRRAQSNKKRMFREIKQYIEKIFSILLDKSHQCKGLDEDVLQFCTYANDGCYDEACKNGRAIESDTRPLINPNWFLTQYPSLEKYDFYFEKRNIFTNTAAFIPREMRKPVNYIHNMRPSEIKEKSDIRQQNIPSTKNYKCVQRRKTFSVMLVERQTENLQCVSSIKHNKHNMLEWQEDYKNKTDHVVQILQNLLDLHKNAESAIKNASKNSMLRVLFFDPSSSNGCSLCTLSIQKDFKWLLAEFVSLSAANLFNNGITAQGVSFRPFIAPDEEHEWEKKSIAEKEEYCLQKTKLKRGKKKPVGNCTTPTSKDATSEYSLNLHACRVGVDALSATYHSWATDKYPWLGKLLNNDAELNMHSYARHCSCDGRAFCLASRRRSFVDSDLMQRNTSVCSLPVLCQMMTTLAWIGSFLLKPIQLPLKLNKMQRTHKFTPQQFA